MKKSIIILSMLLITVITFGQKTYYSDKSKFILQLFISNTVEESRGFIKKEMQYDVKTDLYFAFISFPSFYDAELGRMAIDNVTTRQYSDLHILLNWTYDSDDHSYLKIIQLEGEENYAYGFKIFEKSNTVLVTLATYNL